MSTHLGILILIIQLVLLSFAYQSKAAPLCHAVLQTEKINHWLQELKDPETSHLKPIDVQPNSSTQALPSYLHLKFVEQDHYPHHHMIQKEGPHWDSLHSLAVFAPIGDITNMAKIFGPKVSQLLGFHQINSNTILIPKVHLLNKKIQVINKILELKNIDPIEIQFQEVSSESALSVKKFIVMFADETALPIAATGAYALHDTSFHLSEIGLPKSIVRYAQDRAQLVLKLNDFIKMHGSESDKTAWKQVLNYEAGSIDTLGNIAVIYLKKTGFKRAYIETQFNNGSSPLQKLIARMKHFKISADLIENFIQQLPPEQLKKYQGLLANRMSLKIDIKDRNDPKYKNLLYDQIEQSMIDRIDQIKLALQ